MNPTIPDLVEVKRLSPTAIQFRWSDGREAICPSAEIRRSCRCAHCVNELTGERILDPGAVPDNLTIAQIGMVGRYALQFEFGDYHGSGIYPFELLWKLCAKRS